MAASADQIKAMVKSYSSGDDEGFYAVAMQVPAKAERQATTGSRVNLTTLSTALGISPVERWSRRSRSCGGEIADLITTSFPEVELADLVVDGETRSKIAQVLAEQRQRHHLIGQGFHPVRRVLLEGPPGIGKTMTAAVLAHELDLPLLTIRLDSVLSKYLGETGSKLRLLFDAVAGQRAVYLFDEFDALAGDRAGNDVGEARRILTSFLVFLEQASAEGIVIAATNHRATLDRALFRNRVIASPTSSLSAKPHHTTGLKRRGGAHAGGLSGEISRGYIGVKRVYWTMP